MKTEILRLLQSADGYISGQQLCDRFQVSRTAVWKVVEQLKKEGYQIEAVRNRGYRLVKSPDVISKSEILSRLHTKWAGQSIVCYEEVDSTNTQAKTAGENQGCHGMLVVADRQNAGKGRRGRSWASPPGTNIYMTLLLKPEILPDQASMLTLVMALSVAEAIEEEYGHPAWIKWPNDIVVDNKKVCGILTEMSTEIDYINYVVIGVGINVRQEDFPEELMDKATSLKNACGKEVLRSQLIADVMERFEQNYEAFLERGSLELLKEPYEKHLVNMERQVKVMEPGHEYEASARGIDNRGELLVELPDGTVKRIYAGEVSVRGVYGYI